MLRIAPTMSASWLGVGADKVLESMRARAMFSVRPTQRSSRLAGQ
ncbi:MAG TPA: hypothetical protein VF293_00810 [Candidatus Limnocylindrales bacterium]